ncbi:NAD(P)/FAD-dependent oxidoreductase [Candidatus Poribacteria bacterium]|nr:NAD(P)/FAD-dependent oxidoreductase [Candidatus Poribacteria bacterium]
METRQRPRTSYRKLTLRPNQLEDEYDAIVIGAGVGGLVCGAYLAKFGAKVLIVERHWVPGGLCSFFKRKGFYFDAGAHYFGSLGDAKSFGGLLLRPLELDVEFIPMDPVDILHFPDETLELPGNIEWHTEFLQNRFPQERENIRAFFKKSLQIYRHFYRGKRDSEVLARYRWRSYQEVLDQYFHDVTLKSIFSATIGYIGVYPNQVSSISMISMMMSYFYDGGYLARGGSQALPDSIMRRFVAKGGNLILNTAVKRIVINEKNQASSVILASGKEIRARVIIANADAQQTFFQLIGEEYVDASYIRTLKRYRESNSCFVLYLGIECDSEMLRGKRGWYWDSYQMNHPENLPLYVAIPTLEDDSLSPQGYHILTATSLDNNPPDADEQWYAGDLWVEYKQRREQETLSRLEGMIPGVSQRVVVKESATRRTIYHYTLNSHGAMYGWESSPDQFWLNRLPVQTPFENLFLCGHWTSAGPGVISVIASGLLVARTVREVFPQIFNSV